MCPQDTLGQITNKPTDSEGIKYSPSSGQNIGLQKKLDTTCKENAL